MVENFIHNKYFDNMVDHEPRSDKYFVYNKSSENMPECTSGSIDLIIAGPPYNIGTIYGDYEDRMPFAEYKKMLTGVIKECKRVLKDDGTIIIDVADTVFMDGKYLHLAGLIESICAQNELFLSERHLNFANSKDGIELPEDKRWNGPVAEGNAHSNIHHWLVLKKNQTSFSNGQIFYINHIESPHHPCPYPDPEMDFYMDQYYRKGMKVLDPFMGTAILGTKVIERHGSFIGYEIDPKIFRVAKKNLERQNI